MPGLAMSRSLGDSLAANVGVIAEPDVAVHKVSPNDKCLLLASDGVWEFLTNEEAVETVKPFVEKRDPAAGCSAIIQKARQRWEQEEEAIDDITAVLIIF